MNKNPANKSDSNISYGKLLLSIEIIDEQHSKINELFDKMVEVSEHKNYKSRLVIFDELDEYLKYHFETEENLMRSAGTIDIEKHIQQHDFFRNRLIEIRKLDQYNSKYLTDLSVNLRVSLLRKWITSHFRDFDSLYVDSVKQYLATTGNKK
ncbi:hemerythrin family protein [Labilibaculum sp. K2S]|uniref:bacteriohemerythrin n=1 Tax=Labilibaculum sp. K2S TaxID=3056386 RepID=UPI0025A439BD|nr:hemerythrin family protein [Labilibaculum sp. K2S]MDM8161853.1 hemerythrin family protein [Labilibaculum sp. K2S]